MFEMDADFSHDPVHLQDFLRPDDTFVHWPGWPAYDSAALSEAVRRAVLRLFVRRG